MLDWPPNEQTAEEINIPSGLPEDGGVVLGVVVNGEIDRLLRNTSRSFYLSLGVLPNQIRDQVGLLYLLARVADTIADTGEEPSQLLIELNKYEGVLNDGSKEVYLGNVADLQDDPHEEELLRSASKAVRAFAGIEQNDRNIMLRCLNTIISGQRLDVERFGTKTTEIRSLTSDEDLDDYTYKVAGSVGEFWTEISLKRLIPDMSSKGDFERFGVDFGKGLQMINILRDIPSDLHIGRCYIPSERLASIGLTPVDLLDESSMNAFRPLYDEYLDLSLKYLSAAHSYVSLIPRRHKGLRLSCMLPIIIGWRTIRIMRNRNVLSGMGAKIKRREIGSILLKSRIAVRFEIYEKLLMQAEKRRAC